jgi:hypothetical protein
MTLADVGKRLGVSKQRVHQLLRPACGEDKKP